MKADSNYYYTISFKFGEVSYSGRLTPEFKKGHDHPASWHVVLNEVFFGYLHKTGQHWENSEQRPADLTSKVGSLIDQQDYQQHSV